MTILYTAICIIYQTKAAFLNIIPLSIIYVFRDGYRHAFQIPPDFDDTSVNLGMGSLIRDMALEFPQSNAKWQMRHSNLSSVFSALKHYAYRPMSNESRINTIDTRTYFYMRKFLEWAKSEGRDVALTATWVIFCFCH